VPGSRRVSMDNTRSHSGQGLRKSDFEGLLERLDPDRDSAGRKYEALRRKLIKFFEWNHCRPAEDLADQTLDRVARRLTDADVAQVVPFAWSVAQHVRQESARRMRREVALPDLPEAAQPRSGDDVERDLLERLLDERCARCLVSCLRRLPHPSHELFLAYYEPGPDRSAHRQRLAAEAGLTIRGLRVRVNRLREKLESCVSRCVAGPGPIRYRIPRSRSGGGGGRN
jgi:DNA-directed RNA polymerase specialized sigma24 family protein